MRTLKISGTTGTSTLLVGESLHNLEKYIPTGKTVILTDTNVGAIYGKTFPDVPVITIGTGEKIKTLETVSRIYKELVELEADRTTFVVAIGGGIVCDIAGFAASTYLRGIRFGFVSSSLLSQVDASVGGKNGVNFGGYKNMVGVFNQPEFVICDMEMINTLPQHEVRCGFAEIIKHAAISSREMFDYLEENSRKALSLDPEVIETLVADSATIKASVVNMDEKEKGERRKLNFGHTIGHAFEKIAGISHGEAVAAGMSFAADLSVYKGLLSENDSIRLKTLITQYELPAQIQADSNRIIDAVKHDKKREGDQIHFVLLDRIGHAVVDEIAVDEIDKRIKKCFKGG